MNRAMGTLWIDEQDDQSVKATIGLSESVSFGILGAVDSLNFGFERLHTETGTWLTRWTDTAFKGRKFVIPVQFRKRVDCSNFTRLPPEGTTEPPAISQAAEQEGHLANDAAPARPGSPASPSLGVGTARPHFG